MSDDLSEDVVVDPVNPLLQSLEPVELELLETIWDPIARGISGWPVWDYVSRTLYQSAAEIHDAGAIEAALPRIPSMRDSSYNPPPYGLVWADRLPGLELMPGDHVGLTIAGLVQLAGQRPALMTTADCVFQIIATLARDEQRLAPNLNEPVKRARDIESLITGIRVGTGPTLIPPQVIADLLRHESVPLGITTGPGQVTADLTPYLRPLRTPQSAQEYLNLLAQMTRRQQRLEPVHRGEELLRTLDYVSYVLAAHPAWKPTGRLAVVHDLETAGTLAAGVSNQEEFNHRLSALATLLDGLHTPEPTLEAQDRWRKRVGAGEKDQPRSLARLEIWIRETIEDDARRQRALDAVDEIKSTKHLRNQGQHSGTGPRDRAVRACSRLGIEDPIRNWSLAWEIVRARAADAFDDIRKEVAAQPSDAD